MIADEGELHGNSLAKEVAAFIEISRSMRVTVHGVSSAHDADGPAQGWRSKGVGCDRTLASKHDVR